MKAIFFYTRTVVATVSVFFFVFFYLLLNVTNMAVSEAVFLSADILDRVTKSGGKMASKLSLHTGECLADGESTLDSPL